MSILDDARDLAALAADVKHEHRYDLRVELCQKSRGVEYWFAYDHQRYDGPEDQTSCAMAHSKWGALRDLIDNLEQADAQG